MEQAFLRAPDSGASDRGKPRSSLPGILVAGPAAATETARMTLQESKLAEGHAIITCGSAELLDALADRPVAALLIISACGGTELPDLVREAHRRQRDPLMPILLRCAAPLAETDADLLWDLGVADRQFGQPLDDPALAQVLTAALRDAARQKTLCTIAEASTVLANAETLGAQAALALDMVRRLGFGGRGALFCFERASSGRQLLAIAGSGVFAHVDCTPVEDIGDARAAELARQVWGLGACVFADDFAALHAGTCVGAHPAVILLALEAPLPPWQQRLLEAYANAIAPAIEDGQTAQQLARTQHAMIATLAKVAEYKDGDTGEHVARVARITAEIASHLARSGEFAEIDAWFVEQIGRASILHDVGKVAIPEEVLLKPALLTPEERLVINEHVTIGRDILREAAALAAHGEARLFHLASDIAHYHHERWNGSGYPDRLRGESIPLAARIVAVVDVFDALVSQRPYKEAWTTERALGVIREEAGQHFDPRVVEAFLAVHRRKATARFIEWKSDMSVGHPELDRDHQRLIGILNNLGVNMELGNRNIVEFILDDLTHYVQEHFRREERHLESIGFPELVRHRAIHEGISGRIEDAKWQYFQGFSATLQHQLLAFLTTWLNNHILVEDMRYSVHRTPST